MNSTQNPNGNKEGGPIMVVPQGKKGPRETMDLAEGRRIRAELAGAGTNAELPVATEPGRTMRMEVRSPSNAMDEAAVRAHRETEANKKFLPYSIVHALISKTLKRDREEWMDDYEATKAAVAEAFAVLSEKADGIACFSLRPHPS